eukprot:9145654-Alexandrium_andersonii.AAC.1
MCIRDSRVLRATTKTRAVQLARLRPVGSAGGCRSQRAGATTETRAVRSSAQRVFASLLRSTLPLRVRRSAARQRAFLSCACVCVCVLATRCVEEA